MLSTRRMGRKTQQPTTLNRFQLQDYRRHVYHRRNARALVDSAEPVVPTAALPGIGTLMKDARTYLKRTMDNVNLLLNLARTMRTMSHASTPHCLSTMPAMHQNLLRVERHNRELGQRLMEVKQRRNVFSAPGAERRDPDLTPTDETTKLQEGSEVFAKYAGLDLQLPSSSDEQMRLLRPRIALHFGTMDGRPLGVVGLQLYTEAAPLIVLEFVRKCMARDSHEFSVRRIFPDLWLEGYLQGGAAPLDAPLEFDARVLDQGRHAYVLSCAKAYCRDGFPGATINFTISFKPLRVSNGRRVGFGRVVRGNRVIKYLGSHGTKNGKISKPIAITHCDVI